MTVPEDESRREERRNRLGVSVSAVEGRQDDVKLFS